LGQPKCPGGEEKSPVGEPKTVGGATKRIVNVLQDMPLGKKKKIMLSKHDQPGVPYEKKKIEDQGTNPRNIRPRSGQNPHGGRVLGGKAGAIANRGCYLRGQKLRSRKEGW